jgi:hypothetical protein
MSSSSMDRSHDVDLILLMWSESQLAETRRGLATYHRQWCPRMIKASDSLMSMMQPHGRIWAASKHLKCEVLRVVP